MRELYINGFLIDLLPKDSDPIATSYQINKISEFKDVQANFSNIFPVPKTENNISRLGNSDLVNTNSFVPYRKNPCRYLNNGIDIVTNGVAVVQDAGSVFNVTIMSGNFDIFQQIGDKSLNDLDCSELDHEYTLDAVVALNAADGNVIWPLVQLGGYGNNGIVDIRWQSPAIKYAFFFNKIFEGTTWDYEGEIFSDDRFTKLLYELLPEQITDTQEVLDSKSARIGTEGFTLPLQATNGSYVSLLAATRFDVLTPPDFDSTAGYFDRSNPVNYRYRAQKDIIIDIELNLFFNYAGFTPFSIMKNGGFPLLNTGSLIYSSTGQVPIGQNFLNTTISGVYLKAGDTVEIVTRGSSREIGAPASNFYPDGSIVGQPSNASYIKFAAKSSTVIGGDVHYNSLLPSMKQADFIRNTCNLFGLLMQPNYKTNKITFVQHKTIRNNNQKVDWSNKIDTSIIPSIKFRTDGFGQQTFMRWGVDDDRGSIGDSFFTIDDTVLKYTEDLFVMDFNSSIQYSINDKAGPLCLGVDIKRFTRVDADNYSSQTEYNQGDLTTYNRVVYEYLLDIPSSGILPTNTIVWRIYPNQFEQTEDSSDRLLYYTVTGSFDITDGIDNTTPSPIAWPVAYFADSSKLFDLDFAGIIQREYIPFVQMMQNYKEVNLNIRLSDVDISNIDFFKMVFIEYLGNVFYLTLVDEYQSDEPSTSCMLIRI